MTNQMRLFTKDPYTFLVYAPGKLLYNVNRSSLPHWTRPKLVRAIHRVRFAAVFEIFRNTTIIWRFNRSLSRLSLFCMMQLTKLVNGFSPFYEPTDAPVAEASCMSTKYGCIPVDLKSNTVYKHILRILRTCSLLKLSMSIVAWIFTWMCVCASGFLAL